MKIRAKNQSTGHQEFSTELSLENGIASYSPSKSYDASEQLHMTFEVEFRPKKSTRATALVAGFRGLEVEVKSPVSITANIDHARGWMKPCHLVCLETGESSRGPCLNCPDGEYEIRICC